MANKNTPTTPPTDIEKIERQQRVEDWSIRGAKIDRIVQPKRRVNGKILEPSIDGLGDRSRVKMTLPWRTVASRLVNDGDSTDASRAIDISSASIKLSNASDYIGTYHGHNGVIRPEYDLLEPFVIADTEVYVKQSITRRLALMFRKGFELISDFDKDIKQGQKNVDYIQNRLEVMEYVTGRSTKNLFRDILYNLELASNCFLRKIRDAKASPGVKQDNNEKKTPVAGYQIIPAHQIMPYLKSGVIIKWRRYFDTGMPYEDIPLEDIIHLKWDVKPGHIYGTPRTVGVRDDIFALRRLEENIELLFINHLFPLFHVKIGTEKAPCTYTPDGNSEIDIIRYQIEAMPKEGVFVTDERVEVDSVGAKGESLETKDLIAHLKGRVLTGLGVSPLDMGEGDTANMATADNISQNLKDAVKADQDLFASLMRMFVFKEWFMEAPYSLSVQKAVASTHLVFYEIDLDNLIKEQNHIIQLYMNHLITETEARKRMHLKAMDNSVRKETHYKQHIVDLVWETAEAKADAQMKIDEASAKQQKDLISHQTKEAEKGAGTQMALMAAEAKAEQSKAASHVTKAEATVKVVKAKTAHAIVAGPSQSSKTVKKASPNAKAVQTKNMPTNQHKTNPGPTKAKSSLEFMELLKDRLLVARAELSNPGAWPEVTNKLIDKLNLEFDDVQPIEDTEICYTNQIRKGLERLKNTVSLTTDPELLSILLDSWLESEDIDERPEMESASGGLAYAETSSTEHPSGSSDSESEGNPISGIDGEGNTTS